MRRFDYSFLKMRIIDSETLDRILRIQKLKIRADQQKDMFPVVFRELEFTAAMQSVRSSNAIEGIILPDKRIIEIVQHREVPITQEEKEIAGYCDALELIKERYREMEIDRRTVLELHETLISYLPEKDHGYKKEDVHIKENNPYSNRSIRSKPIPATETEDAMENLLKAYRDARKDDGINPLLLIPCFILDFLLIRPFSEYNRRVSRLLSVLIMYREGIDIGRYISFEEGIARSKDRYYESLKRSSEGWQKNNNDYLPFIYSFIDVVYQCYKELDRRFTVMGDKKVNKSNRIEAIVINSEFPISKNEICELLPDVSKTTVESILSNMIKEGMIVKVGGNRNARYMRKEELGLTEINYNRL